MVWAGQGSWREIGFHSRFGTEEQGVVGRSQGVAGPEHQAEELLLPSYYDGELGRVSKQGSDTVRFGFENMIPLD